MPKGIGDFYITTGDRFLDPQREEEYRARAPMLPDT